MDKKTSNGKTKTLVQAVEASLKATTGGWAKQRKREEKNARAVSRRSSYYTHSTRVTKKDAAYACMVEVYNMVSDNGRLPAHARQLFYAARPIIEAETGSHLDSAYFTQTLWPQYQRDHELAKSWWVVYDARGHLIVPHRRHEEVGVGTIEVDKYLRDINNHFVGSVALDTLRTDWPTKGMLNRCSAIVFIEKEGFHELFKTVKLAERYDIAILSTKGQSVVAARKLVDHLCNDEGVPLLVLHDFDAYGIRILKNLVAVSDTAEEQNRVPYEFVHDVNYIDCGLRLDDIQKWKLSPEGCPAPKIDDLRSDLSPEEFEFFSGGQRCELNAFTSPQLIEWIEAKLKQHGITKVVPNRETLKEAYRRAWISEKVNNQLDDLIEEARQEADDIDVPRKIVSMVKGKQTKDPAMPWDKAVAEIAADHIDD